MHTSQTRLWLLATEHDPKHSPRSEEHDCPERRTRLSWRIRSLLFLTVVLASAPGMPGHAAQLEAGAGKVQPGMLSDFEGDAPAAAFGAGWATLDDSVMGGSSSSSIDVVDGGADGSAQSLSVTGELRNGAPSPWAGAVFFAGATPFANVDLTSFTQISFWARGEGGAYAVVLMTANLGMQPA